MNNLITEEDLLEILRLEVEYYGSQREVAKLHNTTQQNISDILNGRYSISDKIVTSMGYEKIVRFKPCPEQEIEEWSV